MPAGCGGASSGRDPSGSRTSRRRADSGSTRSRATCRTSRPTTSTTSGITGAWVVRRTALRVGDLPDVPRGRRARHLLLGNRGRLAERRTSVRIDGQARVEATAIWVHVDDAGRPAALKDWFCGPLRHGRERAARERTPAPATAASRHVASTMADTPHGPRRARARQQLDRVGRAGGRARASTAGRRRSHRRGRDGVPAPRSTSATHASCTCAPTSDGLACWLVVDAEVRTAVARRVGVPDPGLGSWTWNRSNPAPSTGGLPWSPAVWASSGRTSRGARTRAGRDGHGRRRRTSRATAPTRTTSTRT